VDKAHIPGENYRERAIIVRIGLDKEEGQQWSEKISMDGCPRLPDRKLIGNVIEEHNGVFEKKGRAMFGRFEILCPRWWNMMWDFIDSSCPRRGGRLMIVLRKDKSYEAYSTRVFSFSESCSDSSLVPEYYQDLIPNIYSWFEIGKLQPMNSEELINYMKDLRYAVKRKRTISKTLLDAG